MLYQRKPQLIEAFQWTGGHDQQEDPVWAVEALRDGRLAHGTTAKGEPCLDIVATDDCAYVGEWLVKEGANMFAVTDDEFHSLYEPAKEQA